MAWSDYKICDLCGDAKVFYDANILDERYCATWGEPSDYDPIGLKAICGECNKTHEVVIALREKETADRIEELVKERDELGRKLNTARYGQPDFAWSIHEEAMADLRAKLTKAIEALRGILKGDDMYPWRIAREVLAELEGK